MDGESAESQNMLKLLQDINSKLDTIEDRNDRMEKKLDKYQEEMNKLKDVNAKLLNENELLKQGLTEQEKRIEKLEREIRKNKIVIHGVEEQKEESDMQIKEKIRVILTEMDVSINTEEELTQIRRLGKEYEGRIRPIMIEVRSWNKKIEIFNATKKLRGTKIYFEEDFSKEIIKQRKELIVFMKQYRKEGHHAILKYNNLLINGQKFSLDNLKQIEQQENEDETHKSEGTKKGRTLSQRSPENDGSEELRGKMLKITKTSTFPKN